MVVLLAEEEFVLLLVELELAEEFEEEVEFPPALGLS